MFCSKKHPPKSFDLSWIYVLIYTIILLVCLKNIFVMCKYSDVAFFHISISSLCLQQLCNTHPFYMPIVESKQ